MRVDNGEKEGYVKIRPHSSQFNRKMNSEYFFDDLPPGDYHLMIRQNFKPGHCVSPVTVTLGAHKAASLSNDLTSGTGFGGQNMFQSQAEEQERPRSSNQLPLNLNTYKFMGGESDFGQGPSGDKAGYLLFTGPIQLNNKEDKNTISFEVEKNDTLVRFHAEETGIHLVLKENNDH